jgi:predicted ATPase
MSIKRISLKNFKCFKEVEVSFSKITLLTGENSSGKSSLIYGILAPLQSVSIFNISFPLYLSLNGTYVNMGGFEEITFNHNLNNQVKIELSFLFHSDFQALCGIRQFDTSWYFDTTSKSPKLDCLKFTNPFFKSEIKKQEDLSYAGKYHRLKSIKNHVLETQKATKIDNSNNDDSKISSHIFSKLDELVGFDNDDCPYGFHYQEISKEIHEEMIEEFNFISSFRLHPERTYYQSITTDKIDKFGNGYIDQILEWSDNQSEELYDLISILKDLKILHDIKPHRLSGGRFEIRSKIKSKSKWESLADVGFGISQFLPIIVADLQLSDNSTLIMSQPEIHLHPSVQANLGDYLVKQVKDRNKNYIVETHSEYLLNRMRLLIVKGEIQPEDVAVYYFENSIKDGSIAHRIEFTKDGQILNAPKGFFETYMIDTMDIALNA